MSFDMIDSPLIYGLCFWGLLVCGLHGGLCPDLTPTGRIFISFVIKLEYALMSIGIFSKTQKREYAGNRKRCLRKTRQKHRSHLRKTAPKVILRYFYGFVKYFLLILHENHKL